MAKKEAMFFYADTNKIVTNPRNQNKHTAESVKELADTIRETGRLINPISVRARGIDVYEIICGERRYKAAELLDWEKIPAFLWDVDGEIDNDMMRVIENSSREFNYLSECLELANLHRQGMPTGKISTAIGQGTSRVGEKIAVGYIPIATIEKIRNSKVDWTLVRIISLLRLRQKDGAPLQGHGSGVKSGFNYDYSEINKAVDIVNAGQLQLDELQIYIADRRLEMEAENRERILAEQIAIIEKTQKGEIEKLVEAAKSEANVKLNQELQKALNDVQYLNQEKTRLLTQMSKQTDNSADLAQKEMAITQFKDLLTKKETEIKQIMERAEKEKQQLLGETEKVAGQKAKEIAERQIAEYKAKIDASTEQTIRVIQENAQKKVEQAQIKTRKTVRDGITHFFKLCAELDAAIRNLVLAQMEHMSDEQINDVANQIVRLEKMLANIKPTIMDYRKNESVNADELEGKYVLVGTNETQA